LRDAGPGASGNDAGPGPLSRDRRTDNGSALRLGMGFRFGWVRALVAAVVIIGTVLATPAALHAAPPVRPSMAENFDLGSGGYTLCAADATPTDALAPNLFDRAYAIVCRDAAAPVGHLYALSMRGGDPAVRIDGQRHPALRCGPAAVVALANIGAVSAWHCAMPDGLGYDDLRVRRGRTLYVATGLSGYRSALELGLRSLVADRVVAGTITISQTGAGDAASFARAQAGSLDPAAALAQGYRRNNSGNYAEAAEFFDTLLQRVAASASGANAGPDSQYGEYLVNRALQQSDLGNFAEADALFARADRLPTTDPVELRLRRNFRAIHLINQTRLDDAVAVLDTPMAAADAGAGDAGEIDLATAAALNASIPLARQLAIDRNPSLTPQEKAAVLDAQALALRGRILRLQGRTAQAGATLAEVLYRLDQIRGGRVVSLARLRAQVLTDQAALAEGAGDKARAESLLRQAAAVLAAEYPGAIVAEAADATLAGFLARNGHIDDALALYRQVVAALSAAGGAGNGIADLLEPYFSLLVERMAAQPALADDVFLATQVLLRPGVADTQAVLARELSGGSGEAGRMFRQSLNEGRRAEALRVELARLTALPSPSAADRAAMTAARAQIDQISAEQSAIEAQLVKFPAYRAIHTQALTLPQLRAVLRPGEAYWKLTVVGGSLYSVLVTPDRTTGWKVSLNPADLAEQVDAIRATIAIVQNGQLITSPFDVQTTRALYVALAGPAADDLPKVKHLIFEPDGAMQRLPVTLLIDEPAGVDKYLERIKDPNADPFDMTGIDWLGSHAAVSTALSARAFRDVRATPPSTAAEAYLGLGHNVPATAAIRSADDAAASADECRWALSTWSHPIAPTELFSAQRVIGTRAARVVTGAAFTDTAIIGDPHLGDYRILHFATHGLVTPPRAGCPAAPALVTSFGGSGSEGLLRFGAIFNLHLDADLVVLSACDTAGTADVAITRAAGIATGGGNALDGLVRAFIGAGARSVLASHWPAPDDFQATEHLIDGLFTAPAGTPVAEALRRAQLRLMAVAETSHPYYWAGFALIGDGAQPVLRAQ
jgi:CHAT domain-containing protein